MTNPLVFKIAKQAASAASRRSSTPQHLRLCQHFSTATSTASSGNSSSSSNYVSPLKDFFDMIDNGKTSLGTDTTKPTPKPVIRTLKCGVREDKLRYKTTHYGLRELAPHVAPAEHKVQLRVSLQDLNMTDIELDVLKQIVGSRLNFERKEMVLTSDQFGSRIENKRHLTSMLDRIVIGAKQLAEDATVVAA
mmetsp:Transcript_20643/g.27100  ORF Transcript_20643/g.27100 Transcript_20643/m.27100 type:complete len:192 (+) Transcript_20643:32-607(+)|eukprot:CAMPEP_0195273318 /NCGR_PEP_ID=MMETSP0706-20130129/16411_1 /TAXON_ID=33640 /ORGANISM="Asterionellopsis glacialis, Strain CCMP134" /LENGTH=191 /DNA_ID=CAMNT_0040329831 /DNA_START=22 /DNA_END=597 /DNA_ORIENTATION=-